MAAAGKGIPGPPARFSARRRLLGPRWAAGCDSAWRSRLSALLFLLALCGVPAEEDGACPSLEKVGSHGGVGCLAESPADALSQRYADSDDQESMLMDFSLLQLKMGAGAHGGSSTSTGDSRTAGTTAPPEDQEEGGRGILNKFDRCADACVQGYPGPEPEYGLIEEEAAVISNATQVAKSARGLLSRRAEHRHRGGDMRRRWVDTVSRRRHDNDYDFERCIKNCKLVGVDIDGIFNSAWYGDATDKESDSAVPSSMISDAVFGRHSDTADKHDPAVPA